MPRSDLPAILLVCVSASAGRSEDVLLDFGKKVEAAFPAHALAWAFPLSRAGKHLLFRGEQRLTVEDALTRLAGEKHPRIAVQPLHLVDGIEHAALRRHISIWRQKRPGITISLGAPLLTDETSIRAVLKAMRLVDVHFSGEYPDPEETAVWVGHGSDPPHDAAYLKLGMLADAQAPRQYVGCLNGCPSVDDTLDSLMADGWKKACIMPFFTLAGNHAANDLGGEGPNSWKSRLGKAGISCRAHLRGMLEHEVFAAMWLDRLREALQKLRST